MKLLFVFAVFVLVSEISANEHLASLLMELIKPELDGFREKMRTGFTDLGLPPVDPVIFDPKKLVIQESSADVVLDLPEITVTGLSKFSLSLKTPSAKEIIITLYMDEMIANGQYDVNGKILRIFPIYGNGKFQVSTHSSNLVMTGELAKDNGVIKFTARGFKFDFENIQLNFENLLGGKALGQVVQRILPMFAKTILEKVQPDIEEVGKPRFESLINSVIRTEDAQAFLRNLVY